MINTEDKEYKNFVKIILDLTDDKILEIMEFNGVKDDSLSLNLQFFGYTINMTQRERTLLLDLGHIDDMKVIWEGDADFNRTYETYYNLYHNYIRTQKIKNLVKD